MTLLRLSIGSATTIPSVLALAALFAGCASAGTAHDPTNGTAALHLVPAAYTFAIPVDNGGFAAVRQESMVKGQINVLENGRVELSFENPSGALPSGPRWCGSRADDLNRGWVIRTSGDRIVIDCGRTEMEVLHDGGRLTSATATLYLSHPTGEVKQGQCLSYREVVADGRKVCVQYDRIEVVKTERSVVGVQLLRVDTAN